jgi:hypothetical protein
MLKKYLHKVIKNISSLKQIFSDQFILLKIFLSSLFSLICTISVLISHFFLNYNLYILYYVFLFQLSRFIYYY